MLTLRPSYSMTNTEKIAAISRLMVLSRRLSVGRCPSVIRLADQSCAWLNNPLSVFPATLIPTAPLAP